MPTQLDIPDLNVLVTNDLQTKRVVVRYPATVVGFSPIPLDISSVASASYAETASLALYSLLSLSSSFATTAAYIIPSGLPAGIISSSAQFDNPTYPFTGSFSGSFFGDGSGLYLPQIQTGSFAITGSNVFTDSQYISGSLFFEGSDVVISPTQVTSPVILGKKFLEYNNIRNTALTGSIDFDTLNHSLIYYTVPASGNWSVNFRGNNTTTLNSSMEVGQNITVAMMITNSSPAYYAVEHFIDGVSITPKWQGSAPSGGEENAMEAYSYSIVKTADATFTLIAAKVKFS